MRGRQDRSWRPRELAGDLFGPRGVAVGEKGGIFVTQADGSLSKVLKKRPRRGQLRPLTQVPGGLAPALSMNARGQMFLLTPAGEGEPTVQQLGESLARGLAPGGNGYSSLYRWSHGDSEPKLVADIEAYQQTDPDPWDNEGFDTESNPYGVAALSKGRALVADAAGNDLLHVGPKGRVSTVARIMPRTVDEPQFQARVPQMATEAVPTSVTVGPDGHYYVGELSGFPGTPGASQIWRIKPGARNAVCDPERPRRGPCKRFARGFTSIVDLEAGKDGSLYVTELAKDGWFAAESSSDLPVGSVYRLKNGRRTELAPGRLPLPGGVGVGPRGGVSAATSGVPFFGPDGSLVKIQ